jgi:hypothetical protein
MKNKYINSVHCSLNYNLGTVVCICYPSYNYAEKHKLEDFFQGQTVGNLDPISKMTKVISGGSSGRVVA